MHDGFSATLEELCYLEIPLFGAPEALEGEQKSRATIEGCVGNRESNSRPRQVTATYNIANSIWRNHQRLGKTQDGKEK